MRSIPNFRFVTSFCKSLFAGANICKTLNMSSQRKIKSTLETEARYPFASTDNSAWLLDKIRTSTISVPIIFVVSIISQFFSEKFAKLSPSYRGAQGFSGGPPPPVPPVATGLRRRLTNTLRASYQRLPLVGIILLPTTNPRVFIDKMIMTVSLCFLLSVGFIYSDCLNCLLTNKIMFIIFACAKSVIN